MGLPKAQEKRLFTRDALTSMPGVLKDPETGIILEVKPLDISPVGLGVHIYEEFDAGKKLIWLVNKQEIELTVKWCLESPGDLYGFRLGLVSSDPELDLSIICRS